jgi:hypothetical protein
MAKITYDEGYKHQQGETHGPQTYPFMTESGEQRIIPCAPARFLTALVEIDNKTGKRVGIIAYATENIGIYGTMTADVARLTAERLLAMADDIDGKGGLQ